MELIEDRAVFTRKNSAGIPGWREKIIMFLTAQTISLFGSALVQFALVWHITLVTESGVMVSIATLCSFVPMLVTSLFGGVVADRYSRKKLIIASDIIVAVSTLVLTLLYISGHKDIWMVFLLLAVRSTGTGIQLPAVNAVVPQIVPRKKLIHIGGVNGSLQSIIYLAAPAASGVLLTFEPLEVVLFIDIATTIIGVAIMSNIKIPLPSFLGKKARHSYLKDIKTGWVYIFGNPFLRTFFLFCMAFFFMFVPASQLSNLMVVRSFGNEVWKLSMAEVIFSIGTFIGGIVITVWGGFSRRTNTMILSSIIIGILVFILGITSFFIIFVFFMGLIGLFLPLFSTPLTVFLQENVDENMQGRIFSIEQIGIIGMPTVGIILFGPLSDIINIRYVVAGSGFLLMLCGIAALFSSRLKNSIVKSAKLDQ